jgi:hypothetical protein
MQSATDWQVYRTRFLVRARQLTEPLAFIDPLGREHCGRPGDYLVENSDGSRRIAPHEIFEDIYVPMGPVDDNWIAVARTPRIERKYRSASAHFALTSDRSAS